jgi:hypothetical protein
MQALIEALLKRTSIFIVIIGVILLLIGVAGEVVISTFSLKIPDIVGRVIVGIIGITLIGFGAYVEWKEHVQSKEVSSDEKKTSDKQKTVPKVPIIVRDQVGQLVGTVQQCLKNAKNEVRISGNDCKFVVESSSPWIE